MPKTIKIQPITSCDCEQCKSACEYTPGWFTPGQAEKAAKLKKLTLKEFFARYLAVQYWMGDEPIFALAPALVDAPTGAMYPSDPRGRCVFLKNGRCSIYAARPFECSHGNPCDTITPSEVKRQHKITHVVNAWNTPKAQAQIAALLGEEPRVPDFNIFDMLSLLVPR